MMKFNKLSYAIITTLSSTYSNVYAEENDEIEIETIQVTATKRVQNIQETPIAVQAMSAEDLRDNNVGNFDDFARYIPNISLGGRGPGQADVFIRGLAIQPITVMLSGSQGTMPNVALYLDEQPVTAPGRNLDIYATDLERIEVLPGPQGTLFGASSQAGTIRYITNKPVLESFEAGFDTSFSNTQHGESSHSVEAFINLPLTDDLAFRGAFYSINRGGYIDNVAGEFTLDPAINSQSSVDLGPDALYTAANNSELIEDDFNDSFYHGARLSLKYLINDYWSVLLQHSQQSLGADGVFDFDPEVGDLQVQRYFNDELDDEFNQTSVTVEGEIGALQLVYTGSYLNREIEQFIDYTGYNNSGGFIAYYTCTYNNPDYIINYNIASHLITENRECLDPTKGFRGQQDHRRITQEFRIATDPDQPLRGIFGVFYDDFEIESLDDFLYLATADLGFAPNSPISGANNINPNVRPPGVAFFNDITRSEEQIAFFGEIDYDITEKLTLTLGLRWYDLESDFTGSSNFADGIFQGSTNTDRGRNYDSSGGHSEEPLSANDFIPKISLSYQFDRHVLFYSTYSEGFRPGGFNRGGGATSINPDFPNVKVTYDTDEVKNYEFGWKTLLFDQSLKFNGNFYFIEWSNMQVSRFDPENVSILTFIENSADSEIFGIESDVAWAIDDNWTVFGAMSYNRTELVATNAEVIELSPVGSTLPLTPKIQGNLRARYDWQLGDYVANWQIGMQYSGRSFSSIVAEERQEQNRYALFNTSIELEKEQWRVKFFIDNITDKRAELFINNQDDIPRTTTNRPRTIGINFSYRYFE